MNDEFTTVCITLDDGTEIECEIVTIFESEGTDYIALLPLDDNGESQDGEVYLYRFSEEDGEPQLGYIDDDDEYAAASEGFDAWLAMHEFDEMITDEEEDEEM